MTRTGRMIKFLNVSIGQPFYAHNKIWTRTDTEVGTVLLESTAHGSSCNFNIDPEDEFVEEVIFAEDEFTKLITGEADD